MADVRDMYDIDRTRLRPLLMPGTATQYGIIGEVMLQSGERYYQIIDEHGVVSLMPADVVDAIDPHP